MPRRKVETVRLPHERSLPSPSKTMSAPRATTVVLPPSGAAESASITSNALSAAAIPSSAAWNWVPTIRSGRYTSGARINATIPGSSDMSPYTSRKPMLTATNATQSVASSSSTIEDRNATRRADIVVRR